MNLKENVSLADYSTMHLGGTARYLLEIENTNMLISAINWAKSRNLDIIMIGKGSNIIWKDEGFDGLILVNLLKGFETNSSGNNFLIKVAAGEIWDDTVFRTVDMGLSGIEALSLIPGTAGATPIQNIGAYGQEISQTLVSLEAFDKNSNKIITISNKDCQFSYRTSFFKRNPNQFFVTSITLNLSKNFMDKPFYKSLSKYLDKNNITEFSPSNVRDAVVAIRKNKLPDPKDYYNCGSFFKNPIISQELFDKLKSRTNEDIPHWVADDKIKLSAAWLIEKSGYKNYHDPITGMSTWKNQSLVLVNDFAKRTSDLITFRDKIREKVQEVFEINLIQEPLLLP